MTALNTVQQPTDRAFYQGEVNVCTSCGHRAFTIGGVTAECGRCGRPKLLAHRKL